MPRPKKGACVHAPNAFVDINLRFAFVRVNNKRFSLGNIPIDEGRGPTLRYVMKYFNRAGFYIRSVWEQRGHRYVAKFIYHPDENENADYPVAGGDRRSVQFRSCG
jgi:hypothetical protein